MYAVVVCNQVEKFLKELRIKELKDRIIDFLREVKHNPLPFKTYDLARIKGQKWLFRVRFGDYRLIYRLERESKQVFVLWIGTRGKAYKGL